MNVSTLLRYVRFLHENFVVNQALSGFLNSFTGIKAPATTVQRVVNPAASKANTGANITPESFGQAINILRQLMQPIFIATGEEREVLMGLGILEYSEEGTYIRIQQKAKDNQAETVVLWNKVQRDLTQFKAKIAQLFTSLNSFNFDTESVPEGTGELEVVFDGKTSIEDVVGAKEWISEWYLIIEGYARFLDQHKEDFVFVSITKASPTKLRIRVALNDIAAIVTILTGLVTLQQLFVQRRTVIEHVKTTTLVDLDADKAYITSAEEVLDRDEKHAVQDLAEEQLKKRKIENPEIQTAFTMGVEHQYQFLVQGGTVNVFLPPSGPVANKELVEEYNQKKAELVAIEKRLAIMKGTSTKEIAP